MKEKEKQMARKSNMRLYPIYRMIGVDLLFYYSIEILFLTQVKQIPIADVILAGSVYGLTRMACQIPITLVIDKIGNKNSMIIANSINLISMILLLFCGNTWQLFISQIFSGIAFSTKGVVEPTILNQSIPKSSVKSDIFSKLDGKGLAGYYYISAISSVIGGVLYTVNPYIPMVICTVLVVLSIVLSLGFVEMQERTNTQSQTNMMKEMKKSIQDIGIGFKAILQSKRLKALLLFYGAIWGLMCLLSKYEISMLEEMKMSAVFIGILTAVLSIVSGLISTRANAFHERFRNKSLTVVGVSFSLACIIGGLGGMLGFPFAITILLILIAYSIRACDLGLYNVLSKRYLGNFAKDEMYTKIYAANSFSENIFRIIVLAIGAKLVTKVDTATAMVLVGIVYFVLILVILKYMKTRVGLVPKMEQEEIENVALEKRREVV